MSPETWALAISCWFCGICILLWAMSRRKHRLRCCEPPRRRRKPTVWERHLAQDPDERTRQHKALLLQNLANLLGVSLTDAERIMAGETPPDARDRNDAAEPPAPGATSQ